MAGADGTRRVDVTTNEGRRGTAAGSVPPALPRRWRVFFVVASVGASVPVLAFPASAPVRAAAVILILVQAAALWWLADRPWLGTAVVLLVSAALQLMFPSFGPGIA